MFKRLDQSHEPQIAVHINGQPFLVSAGETVAAAVYVCGILPTRTTPVSGAPRAPFCLMGACYECLMVIDGLANQRACKTQVAEGMVIETQQGNGK